MRQEHDPAAIKSGLYGDGIICLKGAFSTQWADAMREDIEITKLDLALEASELYDDYWLIARSLSINAADQKLLGQMIRDGLNRIEVRDCLRAARQCRDEELPHEVVVHVFE